MDWCAFRLTTLSDSSSVEDVGGDKGKKEAGGIGEWGEGDEELGTSLNLPSEPETFTFRTDIPERTYSFEILLATLIPGLLKFD